MALEIDNEIFQQYIGALNFRPDDCVCVSAGKPPRWDDFFQPFVAITTPQALQKLIDRNEKGENIYISMAPFLPNTKNRKKEFVVGVRHCWVDADKDGTATLERITKDVNSHILREPALVIETSPGKVQVIWRLDPTDFDVTRQELLNRALQVRYNTDEAVTDTARVLRVAGFKNNKYADRPLAKILYTGPTGEYKFADFKIEPPTSVVRMPATVVGPNIPRGQHDKELNRISGRLRHDGLEEEAIFDALVEVVEKRCIDYGADYKEMCRKHAHNICAKPVGADDTVLVGGRIAGSTESVQSSSTQVEQPGIPEIDTTCLAPRPVFPSFVMVGTTLYENLVKPAVETSSKYAELIFMPAVQLVLNYLSGRVRIKGNEVNLNMYLGLISPYGEFHKSSSCKLAHKYFEMAGLAAPFLPSMRNADGRMIIMQAGSTEGFGLALSRISGTHAVLFNDELSKMVSKAKIESASFAHDLLQWYESAQWGNSVVSAKNSFSFSAGTYCFSWQWCTTDRGFNRQWPLIAGIASGMEDRLFFVLSPKEPRPTTQYQDPLFVDTVANTRFALDKAAQKGVYEYEDYQEASKFLNGLDPRSMQLVQMLALYFAVDLKHDEIESGDVERALALVRYRNEVRKYLEPIEAENEEGRVEKEILRELRQNGNKMKYRDLCRNLNHSGYGLEKWKRYVLALLGAGEIIQWDEYSPRGRKIHMVGIPKQEED